MPTKKERKGAITMGRLLLAAIVTFTFSAPVFADNWPATAKTEYVNNCSSQMAAQGLPQSAARQFCQCAANGMEEEFGMSRYNEMMSAQPNPSGSDADRALFEILQQCQREASS